MNSRRIDLIKLLINSNVWISGKELAEIVGVSDRTIRSDIKALNEALEEFNICISSESSKGYFISEENKKKFWSHQDVIPWLEDDSPIPKTPEERELYILYRLLFSTDYLTMEDLADKLYVSKTTIYLDVKKILSNGHYFDNVSLDVSNLNGLIIKARELDKRLLLSDLIKETDRYRLTFDRSFYYALDLEGEIAETDLIEVCEILINVLNKYECSMVDKDLILLSKEIYMAVIRNNHGYFLTNEELPNQIILQVVHDISESIEKKLHCRILKQDRKYIQFCFNSKRLLSLGSYLTKGNNDDEYIVDQFIQVIKEEYRIDLDESENFRKNMLLHMGPMLLRIKANIEERSTIVYQIKSKYPYAYELSTRITPIIYEITNSLINESELVYISLHVAVALNDIFTKKNILVICGSGFATAKLIKSELLARYSPYINRIRHISYIEYENLGDVEEDLIVSTVPLDSKPKNKSFVLVNPILSYQDIENLDAVIKDKYVNTLEKRQVIKKFFPQNLFSISSEKLTFEEAISRMATNICTEGYIDDVNKFSASVLEREALYSTVLPHAIAIPHPMESMSKTSVVASYVFKNSVVKKTGEEVNLVLLFAINSEEKDELNELYKYLKVIVKSENIVKKIKSIGSYEEFIDSIIEEGMQ